MQEKLIKTTAICAAVFALLSMSSIIYAANGKTVEITDVAQDEVDRGGSGTEESDVLKELTLSEIKNGKEHLKIPLPAGIRADTVTVENHYISKELWVIFEGSYEAYYEEAVLDSRADFVTAGFCEEVKNTTRLKFTLNGVYEYRSFLENNSLYVEFLNPWEMYEQRVVIDPAFGGLSFGETANNLVEKNIVLSVAKKLKDKLDQTKIKVYYTRIDDIDLGEEERAAIAKQVNADMLIRLEVNASEDERLFGTEAVYNESFFIPGFGSLELADLLEREVVTAIQGKANGLVTAEEEDYVINHAAVPAAAIRIGYITNKKEAQLFDQEAYADRVAEGIYQTIIKAYEKRKE